ncbi:MAG: Yip1 family protein, partial [Candidatus Methanoperedens sp.]
MKISSYLREYARITLVSIKTPRKFFEEVKSEEKRYLKPLAYILITYAIYTAGVGIGGNSYSFFPSSGFSLFLKNIVSALLFIVLLHLAVRLVKGKGSFNNTVKVICYSEAPLNFAWIFYVLMIFAGDMEYPVISILSAAFWIATTYYVYYIILAGISVTSGITMPRAFAALMVQFFMFAVVIAIFVSGIYLYSTNTHSGYSPTPYSTPYPTPTYENYTPPNPEKYRITAYAGSPPQIDGAVTEEDKWYEGEQFIGKDMKRTYYVTIKHDFEYIYILMEWENPLKQRGNVEVLFEQDADKQDFNLNNGRVDMYIQGDYRDENLSSSDLHHAGSRYAYDE